MPRVSEATAKRLFAVSGNRCAFPECPLPLVDQASGTLTGRICHIKAKSPGGKRYDPAQSDDERNAFENLIVMCPFHHDVIDADVQSYSVDRLWSLKQEHERRYEHGLEPSTELARALIEVSEIEVKGGSFLVALNQSGGQIAHSITNIHAPAAHRAPRLQPLVLREPHERRSEFSTLAVRLQNIGDATPKDARVTLRFPETMHRHTTQDGLKSVKDGVVECERDNRYFLGSDLLHRLYPGDATDHPIFGIHYFLGPDRAATAKEEFEIVTRTADEPPFVCRLSFGQLFALPAKEWFALSPATTGEMSVPTALKPGAG